MRLLFLGIGLLTSASASATDISVPYTGSRANLLGVHAGFHPYGRGVSLGARFGVPILDNGFVSTIDNSVYVNFGADLYNTYSRRLDRRGLAVGIPVALQWNFNFTEEWSAFAEVGVNLYAGPATWDGDVFFDGSWLITAVGGRYHFDDSIALQLRLGSPYASLGISLTL
jgi:hypothetical protein